MNQRRSLGLNDLLSQLASFASVNESSRVAQANNTVQQVLAGGQGQEAEPAHYGKLIAIEGIDGTGKETQARMLKDGLQARGDTACVVSFPRYGRSHGADIVQQYLKGQFGQATEVPALLASLPYAIDRAEAIDELDALLKEYDYVILDRYVSSNIAHQGAKMEDASEQLAFFNACWAIEYGILGVPRPDLTILLDIPTDIAMERISGRNAGRRVTDGHEGDADYLIRVASTYELAADVDEDFWIKVSGIQDLPKQEEEADTEPVVLDAYSVHVKVLERVDEFFSGAYDDDPEIGDEYTVHVNCFKPGEDGLFDIPNDVPEPVKAVMRKINEKTLRAACSEGPVGDPGPKGEQGPAGEPEATEEETKGDDTSR